MAGLLTCYNKGCGQKYDPTENGEDKCRYHPGAPIFHDAYKGWSCCNKKSTDFTEFLNFKGCQTGRHSNEKPIEPEKPKIEEVDIEPVIEERKPVPVALPRPPFESSCITLEPTVNAAFKQQMDQLDLTKKMQSAQIDGSIAVGTTCKNGGCKASYESPASNNTPCIHHPGVPIFHEGLKFWSCCQRKTSDFSAFLDQVGCKTGKHKWIKEESANVVSCKLDWHQTPSNVVVAIYAKNYDYKKSFVKINPIRLIVKLVFPQQSNAEYNIDLELRGIVDTGKATAKMFGTKIEITLPKKEAGHWQKLDYPREKPKEEPKKEEIVNNPEPSDESDVDLDDLEVLSPGAKLTELGQAKVDVD